MAFGINVPPCSVFPVRPGPVSTLEYCAAELWMQTGYRFNFQQQHQNPRLSLVLSAGPRFFDSSYFEYLFKYKLPDPSLSMHINVILEFLLSDFRNPLPQQRVKEFERAYKKGTMTVELVKDLIDLIRRPGGLRKPDILGIVAEGEPGRFELHEVCTVGTLGQTKTELNGKLDQLREQVIPFVMNEVNARQNAPQRQLPITSSDPLIRTFAAEASTWVPPAALRACPLGVSYDAKRNATKVTWACFEPAVVPGKEELVTPGLLPYHIHEVYGPQLDAILPPAVRQDLRRWEGELAKAHGLRPLQLLPEVNPAIQADLLNLTPEEKKYIAITLAVGLGVVFLCIVAWPTVSLWLSAAPVPVPALAPAPVAGGSALITEAESAVSTVEGLEPLARNYAGSVARAAARAGTQAPPPL